MHAMLSKLRFVLLGCALALTFLPACSRPDLENGAVPAPPKIEFAGDVLIFDDKGSAIFEQENGDVRLSITPIHLRNLLGSRPVSPGSKPRLLIAPSEETRISTILEFVAASSNFYKTGMDVRVNDKLHVYVLWQDRKRIENDEVEKPNRQTLTVTVDEQGRIDLNREPHGTFPDTHTLQDRLKNIFQSRSEMRVLREGSNEVETTISMNLPPSMMWKDAARIAEAIAAAGSDRIGLVPTDFNFMFGEDTRKK